MQKAVIYARYSSHSQREESIERQIEICTDYAQRHGMLLVATYTDRKKSGKSSNRPEFQRMIYESRHKLFDVVLVWRFDRFARNLADHGAYEKLLKENGVKVYYLSNIAGDVFEMLSQRPFMQLFDGGVASYENHLLKPQPEIYQLLLEKYGLEPAATGFFDDTQANVDAARALGIIGRHFHSAALAEKNLEGYQVL